MSVVKVAKASLGAARIGIMVRIMSSLSRDERESAFVALSDAYCMHCGNPHTHRNRCRCWDDS